MRSKNPRIIWTAETASRFLDALRRLRSPTRACDESGIPKSSVFLRRKRDADFAAAWGAALQGKAPPAPAVDIVRRGLESIIADPNATADQKLKAARELRLADRFGDRGDDDEPAGAILAPPDTRRAKAGAPLPPTDRVAQVIADAGRAADELLSRPHKIEPVEDGE